MFQFQTGSIKRSDVKILKSGKGFWFQFQTGSIKSGVPTKIIEDSSGFQFQTGSIKSPPPDSALVSGSPFQFQTGSIRRLSKNYINIILHPYSSCQVNFYFDQIRGQFAVDL